MTGKWQNKAIKRGLRVEIRRKNEESYLYHLRRRYHADLLSYLLWFSSANSNPPVQRGHPPAHCWHPSHAHQRTSGICLHCWDIKRPYFLFSIKQRFLWVNIYSEICMENRSRRSFHVGFIDFHQPCFSSVHFSHRSACLIREQLGHTF